MKNNSLLLFLLILALIGDAVLAYKLYECMQAGEVSQNSTPCTSISTVDKNIVMDDWNNFNAQNRTVDQNWGVVCRDAFMRIFSDPDINAVSFYMGSSSRDDGSTNFSIGLVGCQVIPGATPEQGEVITKKDAVYYHCSPWCPPNCYTRVER